MVENEGERGRTVFRKEEFNSGENLYAFGWAGGCLWD